MKTIRYAEIIRSISQQVSDERGAKCGYDLMRGLEAGNVADRADAWERYLEEHLKGEGHTDEQRDGVWVTAIPVKG